MADHNDMMPSAFGGNDASNCQFSEGVVYFASGAFPDGKGSVRAGAGKRETSGAPLGQSLQERNGVMARMASRLQRVAFGRKLCLVAISASLAACSGGGGGSPTPAPQVQVAPKSVTIDAEGDSTMFGWSLLPTGVLGQVDQPAPVILQVDLGDGIKVINSGVGGSTAGQSVYGTVGYTQPLSVRLKSLNAQIVIGNYGINDSRLVTTDVYAQTLNEWIAAVRASGAVPVLEEPNPVCWGLSDLDPYVAMLRVVAQQQNVLLIQQYYYIKSLDWKPMLLDCIHPSQALYKIKADREAQQIGPLVKSMR